MSEYEKQRLERIEANKAKLRELGLPTLAFSAFAPTSTINKRKKKKKKKAVIDGDDVDEYQPSDEEEEDDDDYEEEEEEGVSSKQRKLGKNKRASKAGKVSKKSFGKETRGESDDIDYETALQQAIALSLGEASGSDNISKSITSRAKKGRIDTQQTVGKKTSVKNKSRPQLTEDEVIAHFFSFDVAGKGYITMRDLQRMIIAHDFTWTDLEIKDMIHCFDSDRDGMLSLEDFRSIVSHLKMLQEPETC